MRCNWCGASIKLKIQVLLVFFLISYKINKGLGGTTMEKTIQTIGFFTNNVINNKELFNTVNTELTLDRDTHYLRILKNIYNYNKDISIKGLTIDKAVILIDNNKQLLEEEITYLTYIKAKEIIILIDCKNLTRNILTTIKNIKVPKRIYTIDSNNINLDSILELVEEPKETKVRKL